MSLNKMLASPVLRTLALCLVSSSLLVGCHSDFAGVPANQSASMALGGGVASPLNAFIAVGDTVSLALHAVTPKGSPVTAFDSVQYVFADPTDTQYVRLSPTGVVTGRAPSDGSYQAVRIWIIGFKGGAWAADEALVTVTEHAMVHPVLHLLSGEMHDTSISAGLPTYFLSKNLADSSGTPSVSQLILRYEFRSQDSTKVGCFADGGIRITSEGWTTIINTSFANKCRYTAGVQFPGWGYPDITPYQAGTIVVYANALAYGVQVHDSIVVTVGNPLSSTIAMDITGLLGAAYGTLNTAIAPGGIVAFKSNVNPSYGTSIDIVFDHPEAATASPDTTGAPTGNIRALIGRGPGAVRQFNTPGTYGYTAKVTAGLAPFAGAERHGTITVQ